MSTLGVLLIAGGIWALVVVGALALVMHGDESPDSWAEQRRRANALHALERLHDQETDMPDRPAPLTRRQRRARTVIGAGLLVAALIGYYAPIGWWL